MVNKIEISHKTIIFTLVLLILFWLVYQIKDIILLLFISFILTSALSSPVERVEKTGLPRVLAILVIYLILFTIMALVGTWIFPPLVNQSMRLAIKLPEFFNSVLPNSHLNIETLIQQIIPVGGGVIRFSLGIFNNIITLIALFVFTFYFLLERKNLKNDLFNFVGTEKSQVFLSIITEIESKLGAWVRGQLTLMTIVGVFTFLGLTLLKVDYALPLAILAGLLEIVPIIGPIISSIPAILVGLSVSPGLALIVAVLYLLVQQLENNLFVPTVMRKAVGISPLVTILALMIGSRLAGVVGALLSVPVVVVCQIILSFYLKK